MPPLLKSLLGNGSNERELEEMRAVLKELQQERARTEKTLEKLTSATDRLETLGEPIATAGAQVDAVADRLATLEQRLTGLVQLSAQLQTMDERAEALARDQQAMSGQVATTLEETQKIRAIFEDLGQKVEEGQDLKDRLVSFLEVEKPFQLLHEEAVALRGQVEGTSENLARLREQNDRLVDAHKLAMSKMEALDRRRDDLGRSLQDKERRIISVEQSVHGLDGVQNTVSDVKREIATVKALGDTVVQKAAALEAQREAVERALGQADQLDRAMKQLDAGIRQQQGNETLLATIQDRVASLRSLHETVLERSTEISQLQREADEQTRATRQDLATMSDDMRTTIERFDFEGRGLEAVSQRMADLRGALAEFENRFKGLSEASATVGQLREQSKAIAARLQSMQEEIGDVEQNAAKFHAIRRDLDETGRAARDAATRLDRIEEIRPAVESALRDLQQLSGAHATVKDALEQAQLAHAEIVRMREAQENTRTWLVDVQKSVGELREQSADLQRMAPTLEVVQTHAHNLAESMAAIEHRREFIEEMHRQMTELATLGGTVGERGRQLQARMEAAEQRFAGLASRTEEAERLNLAVAAVSAQVGAAEQRAAEIARMVTAAESSTESVEELAEKTQALKLELDQREKALKEAAKELQRTAALRKEAAGHAEQLGELVKTLTESLDTADKRVTRIDHLTGELEVRADGLNTVEKRLEEFEERLGQWESVDQSVSRSLEQIAARQGTVETLRADLDRMFTTAEKTFTDIREITSAQREVEKSREMLTEVMSRLGEVRDTANTLDERKRQMAKAEERLARAEALLVDVGSSLEALQGQKAIVDQAVEKAGSLQFLLKQAETTIGGLREEREMTARARTPLSIVRPTDADDDDTEEARVA